METRGGLLAILVAAVVGAALSQPVRAQGEDPTQGALMVTGKLGQRLLEFPLEHTDVEAGITGLIATVKVTQRFGNPYADPIEAVYIFPLPENAAVNDMVMKIGDRTIRAKMETREQARKTYEAARAAGKRASLLEQERPNIFTQSVANILPGDKILITITYVQDLKYDHGAYEWNFPMVVGPRYIPGSPTPDPPKGGGWAPDTDRVPDASRITPPVLPPDERSGHDIAVHVSLDAGVPVRGLRCISHKVSQETIDARRADVRLAQGDTIPNKDFILRYDVMGEKPEFAFIPYRGPEGGYFLLMVQPKADYKPEEITPKEMVFVIDCSGSMRGEPISKAKEALRRCVRGMNGDDTFQIVRYANEAVYFSPDGPVPNTSENVARALAFIDPIEGNGGTEMMDGIRKALDYPRDPKRIRIVFFMTDGYIGNETEILAAIEAKLGNARLSSFGVGSSVNRYLLDGMAKMGRGFVQYVRPDEDTKPAVDRFYERIQNPYLTDIEVTSEGVTLNDLYPETIPDLFSAQPVIVHGRFEAGGSGAVVVKGNIAGKPWSQRIPVTLPAKPAGDAALASLWARQKLGEMMDRQLHGSAPGLVEEITSLALEFRLMSPYTSFVAVEEKVVNEGGKVKTVEVPVPMPEGVSYEGVFGEGYAMSRGAAMRGAGTGGGYAGYGGGSMGGGRPSAGMAPAGGPGTPGPAGPAGPAGAMPVLVATEAGAANAAAGPDSWLGVLGTPEPRWEGLAVLLRTASKVMQVPNMVPSLVLPDTLAHFDASKSPLRLVAAGLDKAEDLPEALAKSLARFLRAGGYVLLDSAGDEALSALQAACPGLTAQDLWATHPVLGGTGTIYRLDPQPGWRILLLNGRTVGFIIPKAVTGAADGISDAEVPTAKVVANILSFVLQGGRPKAVATRG